MKPLKLPTVDQARELARQNVEAGRMTRETLAMLALLRRLRELEKERSEEQGVVIDG